MTHPASRTPSTLTALDFTQMSADQIAAHDLKTRFDALVTESAAAGDHHAHLIATYRLIQDIGPVALTELAGRLANQLLTLQRHLQRSAEQKLEREKAKALRESVRLARDAWALVNGPADEDDDLQASVHEAVRQVRAQLERHRFNGGPLTASLTQPPIIRGGQTPNRYVRLAAGEPQDGTLSQGDATLYVQALLAALLGLKLITTSGALAVSPESLPPYQPLSLAERAGCGPMRGPGLIRESLRDERGRRHRRQFFEVNHRELHGMTGPDLDDEDRELARLTDQETLTESVSISRLLAHLKEQDKRTAPALPTGEQARALQAEGRSLHFLLSTEGNLSHHLWTIWSMGDLGGRLAAQLQAEETGEPAADEVTSDPANLPLLTATTQVWNLARSWAARHEQLGGLITAPRITAEGRAVLPLCQNVPESHTSPRMRHALHEDDAHLYVAGLKFMITLLGDAPPVITDTGTETVSTETDTGTETDSTPATPQGGA